MTAQSLKAHVERLADKPEWAGPYLSRGLPLDPSVRSYIYRLPSDAGPDYKQTSIGQNGQLRSTGDNVDVSIWDTGR